MGEPTDPKALSADLAKAVQLLARDAVASAMAAGAMPATEGITLAQRLGEIAAAELAHVERITCWSTSWRAIATPSNSSSGRCAESLNRWHLKEHPDG